MAKRKLFVTEKLRDEHFKRNIIIENRSDLIMEGCDKIIECSEEKIVLKGQHTVLVVGKGLNLIELGNQNMALHGRIDAVFFEDNL